jgi:mRNA interferase RelE/StbE
MSTYELKFRPSAKKEWDKLDPDTRKQFAKKLADRLDNPKVPASRLHNMKDCYKIKLASRGYRLVYKVDDEVITVTVVAVGRRERGEVYEEAKGNL